MSLRKRCVMLPYDMDTAIGINNEGSLVFSYNLEDIDKTDKGADVFNGQQSVLWKNVRAAFFEELKEMYQKLRSTGALSYDKVERMFEEHQAKWPEAIFNEDAYFKYLAPLIDEGSAAYLSMLQGSKAEQRKWWLWNRFKYIDSKYNAGDSLTDVITLRGYAKGNITVTPYADIYATVKYGSYLVQQRAARNLPVELVCPLDNVNDTEIYVYSASQLASVGDLSALKVGYAEFSLATRLQELKLGDPDANYSNTNLQELYLGNNILLRKLDVRNCPSLAVPIDASGCIALEEAYFEGTSITALSLVNGGVMKKLHLPGSITNLTIRNHPMLNDLSVASYNNLTTVWLENLSGSVDMKAIVAQIPTGCRLRLIGFEWTADSASELMSWITTLDTMRGLDENGDNTAKAQIGCTVHIDTISGADLAYIENNYPGITVDYQNVRSTVKFYTEDGSTLLYETMVSGGEDVTYGGSSVPYKSSTDQYKYTFAGWSRTPGGEADPEALLNIGGDRNLYAAYAATLQTYVVKFLNDDKTTLQVKYDIPYGGSASYTGETPVSSLGDASLFPFVDFKSAPTNITGYTECIAQYGSPLEVKEITDSWDEIIAACEDGTYKQKYTYGNYKPLDLGSEGVVNMQIVGVDCDDLADGSGYAPLSFFSIEVLTTKHRLNPKDARDENDEWIEGTGTIGGWEKMEMRSYLDTTVKEKIPSAVRNKLRTIKKHSKVMSFSNGDRKLIDQDTIDQVWIPGNNEIYGTFYKKIVYGPGKDSMKKLYAGTTREAQWVLRDTDSTVVNHVSGINTFGNGSGERAESQHGVVLGFCL